MSFTSWFSADRKPIWTLGFDTDSDFLDITGLTTSDFTLTFSNKSNYVTTTGTGTFSNLLNTTPPTIQYQPSLADVSNPGFYDMHIIIKSGTASQQTFYFGLWECTR